MLFDTSHILFMVFSLIAIIGILLIGFFFAKTEKSKNIFLIVFAVLTVAIHYSRLWVDYFTTGKAEVASTMILAVYPCNVAMWTLLACACIKNKQSIGFRIVAEFTFYLGLFGGVIGIVLNEIYASSPNLADWDVLNGLLSHVTLMIGCIWLLVGGYIKIRVFNVISGTIGLLGLVVDGGIVIGLHKLAKLDPPNCMFLVENPFPNIPWFNTWFIGFVAIILLFAITTIYEQIALKKEDRWYTKLKQFKFKKNTDTKENVKEGEN